MNRNPLEINGVRRPVFHSVRLAAIIFAVFLGLLAGHARATQQQVVFDLTGFTIQDGLDQSGSSAQLLPAALAYSYVISGTVHGTGNLAGYLPAGTSLATAVNFLAGSQTPPFSSYLQGTVVNPGGTLPFTILANKTAAGTIAGGLVNASATFNLGVDATGRAMFNITGVTFLVFGSHDTSDTIVFDSGSVTTTAVLTPAVIVNTPTSVTSTSVVLSASVNPNGDNTTVTFQYGTSPTYSGSTSVVVPVGINAVVVSATLTGLLPGTTYDYAINATNSTGATPGSNQSFLTLNSGGSPSAPTATTGTASSIGTIGATLNGMVNPNGADTLVTFEYGLTTSYTGTTTAQDIGSGTTAQAVNAPVTGLAPGTLYHFQVTGSNSQGVTSGADQTFTTATSGGGATAPTVTTSTASTVTASTATLTGSANPNGADTTVFFNYGQTTAYGSTTAPVDAGSGTVTVPVEAGITGLAPGTTYHFQLTGSNSQGTTLGGDQTFTTPFTFASFVGKYVAAFSGGSNATSGMVTITVSANGLFTGSGDVGGVKIKFSGMFGSDGSASPMVSPLGVPIDLQLGASGGVNSITASVTGLVPINFSATQVLVTKTLTPGAFTLMLPAPADPTLPQGTGYATVTVKKTGAVHLSGKLGDGTTFVASGGELSNGTWPVFALVYGKKGTVAGTITFELGGTLDGSLTWNKPATTGSYTPGAFSTQVNVVGATYTPGSPVLTNFTNGMGMVEFTGGNLVTSPLDIGVTLSAENKITVTTPPIPDDFKMAIKASTGVIKGTFKDPTTQKLRKFNGVILQGLGLNIGAGEFEGATEAGALSFGP